MVAGLAMQAIGLGWLAAAAGPGTGYGTLVAPLITAGIGTAMCFPTVANQVTGSVPAADVGVAAGTNNALNALGGVFGVAILAAIFAAHGSYATHATFINGFRPAEWAAAGASALGVIAAALAPAKSPSPDRVTLAPEPAPARQPASTKPPRPPVAVHTQCRRWCGSKRVMGRTDRSNSRNLAMATRCTCMWATAG